MFTGKHTRYANTHQPIVSSHPVTKLVSPSQVDGMECQVLVPVLDIANHSPHATAQLKFVNQEASELCTSHKPAACGHTNSSHARLELQLPGQQPSSGPPGAHTQVVQPLLVGPVNSQGPVTSSYVEFFTNYGEKDNR
jgi:hypothetical protein